MCNARQSASPERREGGVHTFAFAAGGFLPAKQAGKTLSGMIHICDFCK